MTEKDLEIQELRRELQAYKDTGLEPEEIEGLLERGTPLEGGTAELMKEYLSLGSIDHLRELVQAEKDGRLVVLPCKIGDTVYLTGGDCVIEAEVTCIRPFVFRGKTEFRGNAVWRLEDPFYNDGRILEQDVFIVFGKDAYLTREEAEAALKKGGSHETDIV